MKRILLIIFTVFLIKNSFAQTFVPRGSSAITNVDGRLKAGLNFYLPWATDTTLNGGLDSLGSLLLVIKTGDTSLYMRIPRAGGNKWAKMLRNGDPAGGVLSFNTRTGNVTLTSSDVTTALGYIPPNPNGTNLQYIAGDGSKITFPTIPAQFNPINGYGITITGSYPNKTFTADTATLFPAVRATISGGSGGITSLNGLTGATQTFSTGTTGTDFGISSSGSTHTFNLPIVSGTNTGKVNPALFNAWNAKLNNITGLISQGTNVTITGAGTSGSPYVINSSGGGGGGVSSVATNNGTGITGGTITSTGTLALDTANKVTSKDSRQKLGDSLGILIAAKQPTGNYITALTGDVVATGPGSVAATIQANAVTTTKINNNAVTYAKIQAASGQALLGATGAGNYGEITLGTNLSMAGSVLNATGGGGSVSIGTINSQTKSANGAVVSGSSLVMQTGDTTVPGLISVADNKLLQSKPRVFNVKSYGAVGDSLTNETAAFASCMQALIAAGGGVFYIPNGFYRVDSIRIPAISAINAISIEIVGEEMPTFFFGTVGVAAMPHTGPVIICNSTVAGSVIVADPNSGPDFSTVNVSIKNLDVRTYNIPQIGGIDLYWAAFVPYIQNVFINTNIYNVQASQPTTTTAIGLRTPGLNNGALTNLDNVTITGYYVGIEDNEHVAGNSINVASNWQGINFKEGGHASHYVRVGAYRNKYNVAISGTRLFGMEQLNIEHADSATQTDANNKWQITYADIYDPSNLGTGDINWAVILGNSGRSFNFIKNGGITVNCRAIGINPYVDVNGNVGIGTSTPSALFHVKKSLNGGVVSLLENTNSGSSAYAELMVKNSGGNNIQIGIVSPTWPASGLLDKNTVFFGGFGQTITDSIGLNISSFIKPITFTLDNSTIAGQFKDSGNLYVSQNIGVGTSTPSYPIHAVKSTDAAEFVTITNTSNGTSAQEGFRADNGSYITQFGAYNSLTSSFGALTADAGYLYTESPVGLVLMARAGTATIKFASGSNAEIARFNANGELQIGSTTDLGAYTLQNTGNTYLSGLLDAPGIVQNIIDTTTYKPLVIDGAGHTKKMYWPSSGSGSDTLKVVNEGTPGIRLLRTGHDTLYSKILSATNGLTGSTLPDSTLQVVLGGALTQNTDITGAFTLNLGTTGSKLSNFVTRATGAVWLISDGSSTTKIDPGSGGTLTAGNSGAVTNVLGGLELTSIFTGTDANTGTLINYAGIILPVITANRTFQLSGSTGKLFIVMNRNTAGFAWSPTGMTIKDSGGNTISSLVNGTTYILYYDGVNYVKIN